MNFEASTNLNTESTPARTAITKVDLYVLREMLRLPATVTITGVRLDPSNSLAAILEIKGPEIPEGAEEVTTHLTFEVHRLPKFDKFVKVTRD